MAKYFGKGTVVTIVPFPMFPDEEDMTGRVGSTGTVLGFGEDNNGMLAVKFPDGVVLNFDPDELKAV